MGLKSIQYSQNVVENFEYLSQRQRSLIVNLPITQRLFDHLTLLAPAVWEILLPTTTATDLLDFNKEYRIISIPPKLFELCEKLKIKVMIQSDNAQTQVNTLSPELALIYSIGNITIPRVFIALGLLQSCDITQLQKLIEKFYQPQQKIVDFLLDLTSIRLYRSDKVWNLLVKYNYQDVLGRLSLYVRDFIKNDYIYEKIM